jgi:sterol desaturase/sphingolipid hydroxylase (fatty acid hydroxylase superfamily)
LPTGHEVAVSLPATRARAVFAPAVEDENRRPELSSRVYLPAGAIAALAAILVGVGWWGGFGGTDLAAATSSVRLIVIGPLSLVVLAGLLVAERVRPAQRRSLIARGHRHDVLFVLLNATLVVPLVAALALSFSEIVRALPWLVLPRMNVVPRWGAIAVIVVAMDGCNWLAHLANHRVRMLWRFHEVHHSQEDMNVLTVFRTHPLIHVSYLVALVPGLVLLANGSLSTTVLVVYGAMLALAHSNIDLGFGPLERVFVSPNFHRIHHRLNGAQDVNLGFALTIWDQLAHRAIFPTEETIGADTGLLGRPLIVEQAGPRPRHLSVFLGQLVGPFRPMNVRTDLPPTRDEESSVSAIEQGVGA